MKSVFEPGSYSLVSGNGGVMFVRIEGNRLKFFDHPVDPLRGTLHVQETDFNPSLDEETEHLIEGDVLLYVDGSGVRRLRLSL